MIEDMDKPHWPLRHESKTAALLIDAIYVIQTGVDILMMCGNPKNYVEARKAAKEQRDKKLM